MHVALIEVVPLAGCELCPDGAAGGFARCYVMAANVAEASKAARAKLVEERFRVVGVEWCVGIDDAEWENPESEEAGESAAEARASGEVVVGRLDVWDDDE